METYTTKHKGWTITVTEEKNHCSGYSFQITSPSGYVQYVKMGGETAVRAQERGMEMVDMEIELGQD